jgi:FKBP-type peptidyl-prolyl cis-trans isomerase SlyD
MILQDSKRGVICAIALGAVLALGTAQAEMQQTAAKNTVAEGNEVSIEYTLTLEDKEVVDTNVGGEALTYTQGTGQIIPGLESALEGMKVGESKHVKVPPQEGYGVVNPQAYQEVPKENVPAEAQKVGAQLMGRDGNGRVVRPRVSEIKDKTVVLDFNHPLAGKTLFFDVKVLDVQQVIKRDK